ATVVGVPAGVWHNGVVDTEPDIRHEELKAVLRAEYGLDVRELTFVPKGFASYSYTVRCMDGSRYFLKLVDREGPEPTISIVPDFYLPVTWSLYSKGLFRNLSYPQRIASGAFSTVLGRFSVIVFNFIEGHTLEYEHPCPAEHWIALARSVGRIHVSTPYLGMELTHVEGFEIRFREMLLGLLRDLERVTDADREGRRRLWAALLPRADELRSHLHRLEELQETARGLGSPKVLVHTDLWGANLILGTDGELYILDWEGAMIAPPEHDLFGFTGPRLGAFLDAYEETAGPTSLHADLFAFYIYRRNLEDLAAFAERVLYGDGNAARDAQDLDWLTIGMAEWEDLEPRIAGVRETLDGRARSRAAP
ncbi:MAG: phosphotransferase, partial [Chloroflexota bacterium]|nr:phosphotransferase [Chloroflexota bacterium]